MSRPQFDPYATARSLQALVKSGQLTDCQALAKFLQADAQSTGDWSLSSFDSAFAALTPRQFPTNLTQFAGILSSTASVALNTGQSSGYQPQYQNTTPDNPKTGWNGDQGHHFAAFFQVGFVYGAAVGTLAAHAWEKLEGTPGNLGDIALGSEAAILGSEVGSGQLKPSQLGNAILNTICKH